jgi:hypothetical protein
VDSGECHRIYQTFKRKEIIWDPKHPMHFNKIKKQYAWEELGKEMNRLIDECKMKMETGENEDEKQQWNRKR